MSVAFNGTSSLLSWAGELVGTYPCSIFCWIKPTSASVNQMVLGSGDFGGTREIAIYAEGSTTGKVKVFSNAGGSTSAASTTSVQTTWQPALAVFASATNRKIYYAGGAVVTDSASSDPFDVAHDRFVIGERPISATLRYTGDVAEVAMWSSALSQTDFDSLAGGALPETIQSGTLVEAWKLETAADLTGTNGRTFTATSVTDGATHPISRASGNTIAVPAGTLTLAGQIPVVAVTANNTVGVPAGSLALTGFAPTVSNSASNVIQVPAGTLALTGFAPAVAVSGAGNTIAVPLGTLTLAGNAPTVWNYPRIVTPSPLKNNTATALSNETGAAVFVHNTSTGALVVKKTGLTTDADGNMAFQDASLSPATAYRCVFQLASGAEGLATITSQ